MKKRGLIQSLSFLFFSSFTSEWKSREGRTWSSSYHFHTVSVPLLPSGSREPLLSSYLMRQKMVSVPLLPSGSREKHLGRPIYLFTPEFQFLYFRVEVERKLRKWFGLAATSRFSSFTSEWKSRAVRFQLPYLSAYLFQFLYFRVEVESSFYLRTAFYQISFQFLYFRVEVES